MSEDDILHATFAAFQEPGVFSSAYIAEQKRALEMAALEGNALAQLVVSQPDESENAGAVRSYVSLTDQSR